MQDNDNKDSNTLIDQAIWGNETGLVNKGNW